MYALKIIGIFIIVYLVSSIPLFIIIGSQIGGILAIIIAIFAVYLWHRNNQKLPAETGIEEPEKSWDCPQCTQSNPNTSFDCVHCGFKLL